MGGWAVSIIRAPRPENNFYMLNKSISEDERLSWAARGMLIFLLGKPDNWEVSVRHLINQTQNAIGKASGRDAVRVVLKELEEAGYLKADLARSEGGAFNGMAYTVSEIPEPKTENPAPATPQPENPAPAEPAPANPPLIRTELQQSTDLEVRTDGSKGAARRAKFDPLTARPENVTVEVWEEWCKFRKEIRKPLTETMCRQQAKALQGLAKADAVILKSIANGWTGLFPEKIAAAPRPSRHTGLSQRDHTKGLIEREDGGYAF